MHTYRFNITLDNNDDFFFDVDILPTQTFLDFHKIIIQILQFSGTELASFYMSNNLWKKRTEISLIDMNLDEETGLYEEDEDGPRRKKTYVMADTIIGKAIKEPHQRFIYVYDFLSEWTLYIELQKIIDSEKGITYPYCSKIIGELPTKKVNISLKTDITADELILDEEDEEVKDDENSDDEFGSIETDTNELGEGFDELKF